MDELMNNQERIKAILTEYPNTRDNDMLLYLKLTEQIDRDFQQNAMGLSFAEVIGNMDKYHLPSFGSVGRTRRKMQEKYPELQATEKVQQFRADLEGFYREYARGDIE